MRYKKNKKRKSYLFKYIFGFWFFFVFLISLYVEFVEENFVYEECRLIRVVDGDTLEVELNGKNKTIRLVEIDTEEAVHQDTTKNTPFGLEASSFVKNLLKENQVLFLSKDMTNKDKYGRLLRVVWLEKPINDSEEELRQKSLNALLLLKGYAKVVKFDDYKYQNVFKKFEKEGGYFNGRY